jgi:large subunit ribosomal protein L15
MKLNELFDLPGSRKRGKRVGRGIGSGKGKTCGRGVKGQKARAGVAIKGFEGGQMPLIARLPKRGFNCPSTTSFIAINFEAINTLLEAKKIKEAVTIDKEFLVQCGLIKNTRKKVKLLAKGELKSKFDFKLDAYSESAKTAIEKAGGKIL